MDIEIRIYQLDQNGEMHELSSMPIICYGGVCPNVGDVLCSDFTALGACFYSVQHRYFIETGSATGWAIVVRRLDAAPQQMKVYETWKEDTAFWKEVDERERMEELKGQPPEPIQPPLDWREQRVMDFLVEHGVEVPVNRYALKNFGRHTQQKLQTRGYVAVCEEMDRHGNPDQIWLTKAGQRAMRDLDAHRSKYLTL